MSIQTIADSDSWLEPYRDKLEAQHAYIQHTSRQILNGKTIEEFSLGHLFFGLHRTGTEWVFREWAPNATAIYLLADINQWKDNKDYELHRKDNGIWEIHLPLNSLTHGDHYKLRVHWNGGSGERLPSYTTYAVQNQETHAFDAVVWSPRKTFEWHTDDYLPSTEPPLIYEAHVGMSGDREAVSSYRQFTDEVLPRIVKLGYNTVQLMAIQEHPYYGSFGYHVSNLFAVSSRFGTPDDLKYLIDTAHSLGLRVILDIIHSHATKNENEGLSRFDGSTTQYFHEGERGNHPAWDSRIFDYSKPEVIHLLLSNIRYWLDEYHFDGFRFDGITSMLYQNHGLEQAFTSYDDYFSENIELDALTYLSLATTLAHTIKPSSLLIAEDMSAFPGLAASVEHKGIGFDYRLSMGVPDLWIKILKEKRDEEWDLAHLFHELTSHRPEEHTISYAESHDQALVGDKTLIFRLMDDAMYDHMQISDPHLVVERGIALHKIIRLLTASTNSGGYLNFMGNEFGHPEWIDFPRKDNGWSYSYARRQWKLADDPQLKYQWLNNFDTKMISLIRQCNDPSYHWVHVDNNRKILSYFRDNYLFVYNLSPETSYTDHQVPTLSGNYELALSSDSSQFGGQDRVTSRVHYEAKDSALSLYLPSRVALVFRKIS